MPGRVQLALNVNNLDESITFYTKLFGTEPAKVRPGYANFAIAEPPLKLILMENPGQGGSLNHLGVEVADTDAVDAEQARLAEAGLAAVDERDTTCCYARQDKFWVEGAPERRAVGDLHRPGRQPDLLGPGRQPALGRSRRRTRRRSTTPRPQHGRPGRQTECCGTSTVDGQDETASRCCGAVDERAEASARA